MEFSIQTFFYYWVVLTESGQIHYINIVTTHEEARKQKYWQIGIIIGKLPHGNHKSWKLHSKLSTENKGKKKHETQRVP